MGTEIIKLKGKNDELDNVRAEFTQAVADKDNLINVECKNIENSYMLCVGHLEYQAFEKECKVRKLKRETEMMQALKNRQEKIDSVKIEEILEAEFEEYKKALDEKLQKVNDALNWEKAKPLTDEEIKTLKKKYKEIIKALHPDLHPEVTEAQKELFNNAVIAYENGSLENIEMIWEIAKGMDDTKNDKMDFDWIESEILRLRKLIDKIHAQIEKVKKSFPYTMKEFLQDSEAIENRKDELNEIIASYETANSKYQNRINELITESDKGRLN